MPVSEADVARIVEVEIERVLRSRLASIVPASALPLTALRNGALGKIVVADASGRATWDAASAIDHGGLSGLADDDHPQYHNDARGDARYWTLATDLATQAELDAHGALTTGAHGGIVASSDARLTDARTPTAHAASHKLGGSDAFKIHDLTLPTAATPMNGQKFTGLGAGSGAGDSVRYEQVVGVYQPIDSDLTTIAGLTPTTDNFMVANASAWASRTPAQAKTSLALVKADVGLGNADNTSDANKPVSTAQQTELNLKANLASPAFTGNPTAPTPTAGDNDTSVATTAFVATAVAGAGGTLPPGMIAPYAATTAPSGWLLCAGQAVSQATYAALYAIIGHSFAADPGGGNFVLPDLRGRIPVGLDNLGGTDAGRLAAANTLGGAGGAETHTLVAGEMEHAHSADPPSTTSSGDSGSPSLVTSGGAADRSIKGHTHTVNIAAFDTAGVKTVTATGHNNMQPYLLLGYIIKT